ncbi:MAG: hypothetical protein Q7J85_09105 [Bacillota bacterium]|nr:hypothetical protein [Bacillota bacterium]
MYERFNRKPFTSRIKDTSFLLQNTFKVVGTNKDIIKPTMRMAVLSIILTTLLFISLLSFFTGRSVGWGVLLLLGLIFVLTPMKFFYYIRQKANQSWLTYNTITGSSIGYRDAHRHTKKQKSSLRQLTFIEIIAKYVGSQRGSKSGVGSILTNLFLSAFVEIWDLLSHYMLPAVVVEQKPLRQLVPQIKSLRNNVPATLVGVFGIDFVGNIINMIVFPLYLVTLLIGVGIGYLLSSVMPDTVWTLGSLSFSWVPPFIALYIVFIIGGIVGKFIESTKVIYFTIFYAAISHPQEISVEMRDELTHYLQMADVDSPA